MKVEITPDADAMGRRAAQLGGNALCEAIASQGHANMVVATGASQFEVLKHLVARDDIDWSKVTGFHLDEYIGLAITHGASFRKYLKERLVDKVPLKEFHYVQGDAGDPRQECQRLGELIQRHSIEVMFCGIGENGHLAFNDPPADFETTQAYIIVDLDDTCRRQQLGEGWFETIDDVPRRAISMSIHQIMQSSAIICNVPDERKAAAVQRAVEGPVTPKVPASILQQHDNAVLLLDEAAGSQLTGSS